MMRGSDQADQSQVGWDLHGRLLAGDLTASAEIAEIFLPEVLRSLQRHYPSSQFEDLIQDAAEDAILNYLADPATFDAIQMSLLAYLIMSARYDLLNILAKSEYRGFPKATQFVELDEPGPEQHVEPAVDSLSVEEQVAIRQSAVWPTIQVLLPKPMDRELALLLLEGVRETSEFASVLGITELPASEQELQVKRHKDRIKKMLQRHINRAELDETS